MTSTKPVAHAPADDDAGAVAARCFQLAGQLTGGPVRDALLAMGRDYTLRARDAAQTASFRREVARGQAPSPRAPLGRLLDFLAEWTAPVPRAKTPQRAVVVAPTVQRAARAQPAPERIAPQRGSRLYRLHALTRPGT